MMLFDELIELVRKLRSPDGCPWDREQTRESLIPYFIEEVHEAVETIENADTEKLKDELGDVLLHVVFQSVIAEENKEFTFEDVLRNIRDKMIRRHPHVFGEDPSCSPEEADRIWEAEKSKEKSGRVLDGIPRGLPELHRAYRMQQKAASVGFDWDDVADVWKKLDEEIGEFRHAVGEGYKEDMEDELGDILFALVNLSRFYDLHPGMALKRSNDKFYRRFSEVENHYSDQKNNMHESTLEELDTVWEMVKSKEKT